MQPYLPLGSVTAFHLAVMESEEFASYVYAVP